MTCVSPHTPSSAWAWPGPVINGGVHSPGVGGAGALLPRTASWVRARPLGGQTEPAADLDKSWGDHSGSLPRSLRVVWGGACRSVRWGALGERGAPGERQPLSVLALFSVWATDRAGSQGRGQTRVPGVGPAWSPEADRSLADCTPWKGHPEQS